MIAVLADDLTSALDGAAPFAARLLAARVVLDASAVDSAGVVVISVDLDSRFLDPVMAEERFAAAAACLPGARVLYKTVDSTLRGNIGAEIRGALRGSRRRRAVVAPAFPAAGRITLGGRQLVDGVPLERTPFADDPRTPVTSSRVADLLVGLDPTSFEMHDAAHDRDLDSLVSSLGLGPDLLWVGSPGLAGALARAVEGPSGGVTFPARDPAERVLVVVGSMHSVNVAQVERLAGAGAALVRLDAGSLHPAWVAAAVSRAFGSARTVCLLIPQAPCPGGADASAQLAQGLGAAVAGCATSFDGLVATGGDTARRIVDALGASALDLAGEIEPGVPLGVLRGPDRSIPFATKAGGFGHPDTLLACVHRLRSPQDLAR